MAVEHTINVLYILSYSVSTAGPQWLGLEKNFKIKALRWLENAILKYDFVNTVFHNRVI